MIPEENMPENAIPQQILVLTAPVRPDDADLQPRRGSPATRLPSLASVDIVNLQGQVNVFLQQLAVCRREILSRSANLCYTGTYE